MIRSDVEKRLAIRVGDRVIEWLEFDTVRGVEVTVVRAVGTVLGADQVRPIYSLLLEVGNDEELLKIRLSTEKAEHAFTMSRLREAEKKLDAMYSANDERGRQAMLASDARDVG